MAVGKDIVRKAGDTYPNKSVLKVNGVPIDLIDWRVELRYKARDTNAYKTIDCIITDPVGGKVAIMPHARPEGRTTPLTFDEYVTNDMLNGLMYISEVDDSGRYRLLPVDRIDSAANYTHSTGYIAATENIVIEDTKQLYKKPVDGEVVYSIADTLLPGETYPATVEAIPNGYVESTSELPTKGKLYSKVDGDYTYYTYVEEPLPGETATVPEGYTEDANQDTLTSIDDTKVIYTKTIEEVTYYTILTKTPTLELGVVTTIEAEGLDNIVATHKGIKEQSIDTTDDVVSQFSLADYTGVTYIVDGLTYREVTDKDVTQVWDTDERDKEYLYYIVRIRDFNGYIEEQTHSSGLIQLLDRFGSIDES